MIRHLFVPGLFGPIRGMDPVIRGEVPNLEKLLARADRMTEPPGLADSLFALCGIEPVPGADLPTAAVSLYGEDGATAAGFVMHADPLHLVPDRDWVLAFGLAQDTLAGDEIAEVVDAFNAHFADEGLTLFASRSGRLYLRCDPPPSVVTYPLDAVIGRRLGAFMPTGPEERRWRGLLNETQMLCHSLACNQSRESHGRLTIGGLWFSGGGVLPQPGKTTVAALRGDSDLARGLLALSESVGNDELVAEQAPWRAVLAADAQAWNASIRDLDARVPGLLADCGALVIHTGDGVAYRWQPSANWRVWRRQYPLQHYAVAASNENDQLSRPRV